MPAEWSRGCVSEEALAAEKTELEEVEAAFEDGAMELGMVIYDIRASW